MQHSLRCLVIVKVRTITLFGEVWGIGPVTALKLYEKGHRTLDDLKNEDSLTSSQRLGLEYFDDIKKRIPRDEVQLVVSMAFTMIVLILFVVPFPREASFLF